MKRLAIALLLLAVTSPVHAEETLLQKLGLAAPSQATEQVTEQVRARRHRHYRRHRRHRHRHYIERRKPKKPVVEPQQAPVVQPERLMTPADNPQLHVALEYRRAVAQMRRELPMEPVTVMQAQPDPVAPSSPHRVWGYVAIAMSAMLLAWCVYALI